MIILNFYWAIILPSNGDKIASNRCGPSFHDPVEATKPPCMTIHEILIGS